MLDLRDGVLPIKGLLDLLNLLLVCWIMVGYLSPASEDIERD